ncbi:MAG: DUF1015 domain-containing protein [Spirochaetaceae bacterium]|jgi:hypothetical protein|nr:DUF1015 domain-containing protein [Spirochaetaceae bacterium]
MNKTTAQLDNVGVKVPQIILPAKGVDLQKWAVIACDQYTQDPAYWENTASFVGEAHSTLNMIYPEIYLNRSDRAGRIERIHETMRGYAEKIYSNDSVLNPPRKAGAYIERTTRHGIRRGLLLAVDLECYDWCADSRNLVRATEETLRERLPARMEIRRNAALELPHILLLIDDRENILASLLEKLLVKAPLLYDIPLMMGGGSVSCKLLYRKNDWALVRDVFEHLARVSINRYNIDKPFLFAVGDGNHSLAAAKEVWDEYKSAHQGEAGIEEHPARYALAEIVNLHDPAIVFEPIHRIVFNTDAGHILKAMSALPDFSSLEIDGIEQLRGMVADRAVPENRFGMVSGGRCVLVKYSGGKLPTASIDPLLEGLETDYIHGEDELIRLAVQPAAVGILLPPFDKYGLFETIVTSGPLPRKSFSMGEACEKRFYLEARRLFG